MKNKINTVLMVSAMTLLTACGGSSNTGIENPLVTKGYLTDSPIQGVTYECGGITGTTTNTGEFECVSTPVVFKIGGYEIGSISDFTSDTKVYPQDLLALERDNFTDSGLIALIRLLQSLDDDGIITETINIPTDTAALFTSAAAGLSLDELANIAGVTLVSELDAINHLKEQLNPSGGSSGGGTSDATLGGGNAPTTVITTFIDSLTTRLWELNGTLGFGTDDEFVNDGLTDFSISSEGLFSLKKADGSFHTWYFDSATDTNSFVGDIRSFAFSKGDTQIGLSYHTKTQQIVHLGFSRSVNSLPSYGWNFETPIEGSGGGLSGDAFTIVYNNSNLDNSAFTACDATDAIGYTNHGFSSDDSWFWRKDGIPDSFTFFMQVSVNNPTQGKFTVRIVCGSFQEWSASGTAEELGASFDVDNQTATFNNTVLGAAFNVLGDPAILKSDLSITLNGDLLQ